MLLHITCFIDFYANMYIYHTTILYGEVLVYKRKFSYHLRNYDLNWFMIFFSGTPSQCFVLHRNTKLFIIDLFTTL